MKTTVLKKILVLVTVAVTLAVITVACGQKKSGESSSNYSVPGNHPVIEIIMADDSKMTFELYP